ncbi:MAG TPA: protein kinase [Gemmatimonadaceae bacterium]|nr:protein kinase [Gemmatimonadaceae bacterium]
MSDELESRLQQQLGTAYALERELEGGGMSRVFVARDNALSRAVAIKVLRPTLAATMSVDRFRREIMLAAGLQHPNLVPVLSAGEVDGLPYFIMPFVKGESLRVRLRRGPLSVRETVGVMRDVARGRWWTSSPRVSPRIRRCGRDTPAPSLAHWTIRR